MGVIEALEVEAGFSDFVEQIALVLEDAVQVEREIVFARRKTDRKPLAFTGLAPIAKAAKADGRFAQHFVWRAGELFHERLDRFAIRSHALILHAVQKLCDVCIDILCFQSHEELQHVFAGQAAKKYFTKISCIFRGKEYL